MSEPYLGEIMIVGFNFAPRGWMSCDGQLLAIAQNDALFSLLGTQYGGDGQNTFAVPDFRGRQVVHRGQGPGLGSYTLGEQAGTETVTLNSLEMPAHTHSLVGADGVGTSSSPVGNYWAGGSGTVRPYHSSPDVSLAGDALGPVGGSQPHENMAPFLTLNFIICTYGIYPSRN